MTKRGFRWLAWLVCLCVTVAAWGGVSAPAAASGTASASLPQVTLPVGGSGAASLSMDATGLSVVAIDLTINWDPSVLRLDAVALGDLAQGWAMAHNLSVPGELRVAMSAMAPIDGSGSLLDLTLVALGADGDVSALTITQCSLNDGSVPCALQHGQVVISDAPQPYRISLPLVVGWNLLSLPVQPSSAMIGDILEPIADSVDLVLAYDPGTPSDPWRRYGPAMPDYACDLVTLRAGQGFWVKATAETKLLVEGKVWEGDQQLSAGWNLIGYRGESAADVAQALSDLTGQYAVVYGFDANNALSPWTVYAPDALPQDNTLAEMVPGRGYWILMNQPGVWQYPS